MFLWLCLHWWYSAGWKWAWQRAVVSRVNTCMEMFSVFDLSKSLFAPFKQTYAGFVKGSIGDRFRAFLDRSFSRVFGFFIRSMLILCGLICGLLAFVSGVALIAVWAFIPASPIVAVILWISGAGL